MSHVASLTAVDVKTTLIALAAAHICASAGSLPGMPLPELVTARDTARQLVERLDAEIGRRDTEVGRD